jgi:hypothetical protein
VSSSASSSPPAQTRVSSLGSTAQQADDERTESEYEPAPEVEPGSDYNADVDVEANAHTGYSTEYDLDTVYTGDLQVEEAAVDDDELTVEPGPRISEQQPERQAGEEEPPSGFQLPPRRPLPRIHHHPAYFSGAGIPIRRRRAGITAIQPTGGGEESIFSTRGRESIDDEVDRYENRDEQANDHHEEEGQEENEEGGDEDYADRENDVGEEQEEQEGEDLIQFGS